MVYFDLYDFVLTRQTSNVFHIQLNWKQQSLRAKIRKGSSVTFPPSPDCYLHKQIIIYITKKISDCWGAI